MDEKFYWLGFSVFPGIGPKKFKLLTNHFKSAKNAWYAEVNDLYPIIGPVLTAKFAKFRQGFEIEVYVDKLTKEQINFLTLTDLKYPSLLKGIDDSPFVLYLKGNSELFNFKSSKKFIAVVGTRKITSYGKEVTEMITRGLVKAGFVIISGLAYGVDACAHRTTINNSGFTIAVLGCGVDCCHPIDHRMLYKQIIESGGCIVSQYPIGIKPLKGSFPARNRVIAGLSNAVVVTEGSADSGSLYTASFAIQFKRPVYAVPGPVTSSLSQGPNFLIAKGAKLVTSTEDILREFKVSTYGGASTDTQNSDLRIKKTEIKGADKEEQLIIDLLNNEQLHFDELTQKTKMGSSKLGTLLSIMEMKGFIKADNGLYSIIY